MAARAAAGEPSFKWPKTNTASEFIVNSFHVDKDDAQLLTLLEFVFGNNASEDSDCDMRQPRYGDTDQSRVTDQSGP